MPKKINVPKNFENTYLIFYTMKKNSIDNFDINPEVIEMGNTPLSFLVKSDTSDTEYMVNYIGKQWSCTCKAFVYSKAQPQTSKHINKIHVIYLFVMTPLRLIWL